MNLDWLFLKLQVIQSFGHHLNNNSKDLRDNYNRNLIHYKLKNPFVRNTGGGTQKLSKQIQQKH